MTEPVIVRGGTVVDGSGAPGRIADVVIENGRIRAVGDDLTAGGAAAVDAAGKVVAPGFIDIKTHSDWTLPLMPLAESKVRQGGDHRGDRPLRLFLRPGIAGEGRGAEAVSQPERALARLRRDRASPTTRGATPRPRSTG